MIRKIYKYLAAPQEKYFRYFFAAFAVILTGQAIIFITNYTLSPLFDKTAIEISEKSKQLTDQFNIPGAFFYIVLLAPILESIILVKLAEFIKARLKRKIAVCTIIGTTAGVIHYLANGLLINGINAIWLFFNYSLVYLSYLEKDDNLAGNEKIPFKAHHRWKNKDTGLLTIILLHVLNNLIVFLGVH